jgi:EAL domain-containing protein (putative c-di-GMP-specific phosphodiesterase class I)
MNTSAIAIVDDDPLILESLAVAVARSGRTVYLCSDIESAEVVLSHTDVSHVLADVQFSGRFGFEGLSFLAATRVAQPGCHIVLMSGYGDDELRDETMMRGADAFLQKPFELSALEEVLDLPFDVDLSAEARVVRFPSIAEIVGGPSLQVHLQPIVDLRDSDSPLGYEALARYTDAPLPGNAWLFDYARRKGRKFDLNAACVRRAIAAAAGLPSEARIFINIDPSLLADGRDLAQHILTAATVHRVAPSRLVIELTEETTFADADASLVAVEKLRAAGVSFALDDFGSGFAHLTYASAIQPAFVKVSQILGTAFEGDEMRRRIIGGIASMARRLGCLTIVEGVESEETATALREAGIPLAQGYYFGRPSPPVTFWASQAIAV